MSNPLIEECRELWDHATLFGMRASDDLRKELGINEASFRGISPTIHARPSRCFVYRLLDEIQKGVVSIIGWRAGLSEMSDVTLAKSEKEHQIQRLSFEAMFDDEQFRARKLVEALVEGILFSSTNDEDHYRDYFRILQLNEDGRSQQDRTEFYGHTSRNAEWHAKSLLEEMRESEKQGFKPESRWYLRKPGLVQDSWATEGVPFSSFRRRYIAALKLATPMELSILGLTYNHAYGMSRDVHFTAHDISSDYSHEQAIIGVHRVAILVITMVLRCQRLLDCTPEGMNKTWREIYDGNDGPARLIGSATKSPAEQGDIVLIYDDYAEVIEKTTSSYGYISYQVRFLEEPPLPGVITDWFPGSVVRLICQKVTLDATIAEISRGELFEGQVVPPTPAECERIAKESIILASKEAFKPEAKKAAAAQPPEGTNPSP